MQSQYPPPDSQPTVPSRPVDQPTIPAGRPNYPPPPPVPQAAYPSPYSQQTQPTPIVGKAQRLPYEEGPPRSYQQRQRQAARTPEEARKRRRMLLLLGVGLPLIILIGLVGASALGLLVLYGSGDILPGVSAGGIELGGQSEAEAANTLAADWNSGTIVLTDEERRWEINPVEMGFNIDAQGTAQAAHAWGRDSGGLFGGVEALFTGKDVEPRLLVDLSQTRRQLESVRSVIEQPAVNAGIRLVDGVAQPVPPVQGRVLDIEATLRRIQADAAGELADGELELVMIPVAPAVTDATPLVQQASSLLSSPLTIEAYDPVNDEAQLWTLSPQEWSQWLVASPDTTSPLGLSLSLDSTGLGTYLNQQAALLGGSRYVDVEASAQKVNEALASNQTQTWIRVYHHPTTYTVQSGDTFSSIGYDLGIPYPWLQAANPGVGALSPGQTITVPSRDDLLPLPIVRNKRIVVSISEQHLWAYENGALVFDWVISTGIARSPTSPGIFQVRSHEINAYAAQWNLYMPHFMGVYNPGPGVEVMNGFHGFPTDANGGYLLWTSSLGRPATYGCILLSLENAETLYSWAQEGVVVEIRR